MPLFSDMVVFSSYAMQVVMSFMMLVMIFMILPRASVAAARVNEVLDTPLSIVDGKGAYGEASKEGEVEFRNVSFRYPDAEEYVLHSISFTAKKGQPVAFIGSTGCGKSTVINMVPRFYDATDGDVLVDGVNVKDYTQTQLRNKIGYVSQKAILFTGTVRSNVAFGDNGQDDLDASVEEAVATAQAAEFVEHLEDTYDGFVAPGGSNLSGGQKQRLSIARAMIADRPMLILDEATSSVDTRTELKIQAAMDKLMENRTSFVIAHRLSTIKNADLILVMRDGDIVESGTHAALLQKGGFYAELYNSQFEDAS